MTLTSLIELMAASGMTLSELFAVILSVIAAIVSSVTAYYIHRRQSRGGTRNVRSHRRGEHDLISAVIALSAGVSVAASLAFAAAHSLRALVAADIAALGEEAVQSTGLWIIYFAAMVSGMAGQYMWGLRKVAEFDLMEFVRPLWVAIIVFAAFWSSASLEDVNFPAIAAAYQNGFFWKVTLQDTQKNVTETSL